MFSVTYEPIDIDKLHGEVADVAAGAVVAFEGRVRNHNEGHRVDRLEYQIYDTLALSEGQKILEEARKSYAIHHAVAVHRGGLLALEDCAVYVAVSSSHRKEAFMACAQIIDEIKHRLPIWKKEHYSAAELEPVWVNCQRCAQAEPSLPQPSSCHSHSATPCSGRG